MKSNALVLMFALPLLVAPAVSAETVELQTQSSRYSYTMGVRVGQLLKSQGVTDLDAAAFAAAIDDMLQGHEARMSSADMREAVAAQQRVMAERRATLAAENLKAGQAFLTQNAGRADVVVLPSGLQYKVLGSGDGEQPTAKDKVRVHYHGTLIDGTVFDSSVQRGEPADFPLAGVVPGFREALSLMHVGDHWRVFMPSSLAYGEAGAGGDIGPNATLIFDLQLLDILR